MIDARVLHAEFRIKRCFTTWIKGRVKSLNLVRGCDYFISDGLSEKGSHPKARRQKIKIYSLTEESSRKIREIEVRVFRYGVFESIALSTIEQAMKIKIERQYRVGKYIVDGYHKGSNTAYEIDEAQHFANGELKRECIERQAYIERELGCKFIRIKV